MQEKVLLMINDMVKSQILYSNIMSMGRFIDKCRENPEEARHFSKATVFSHSTFLPIKIKRYPFVMYSSKLGSGATKALFGLLALMYATLLLYYVGEGVTAFTIGLVMTFVITTVSILWLEYRDKKKTKDFHRTIFDNNPNLLTTKTLELYGWYVYNNKYNNVDSDSVKGRAKVLASILNVPDQPTALMRNNMAYRTSPYDSVEQFVYDLDVFYINYIISLFIYHHLADMLTVSNMVKLTGCDSVMVENIMMSRNINR